MSKITNNVFQAIRDAVNISNVIQNYIKVIKKGNNYWAICPFHNDTNESLSISDKKQIFKCFSCNHAGDVIKFVADYKKIPYVLAAQEIIRTMNLDLKLLNHLQKISPEETKKNKLFDLNKQIQKWFINFLNNKNNKHVLDYLVKRNLNQSDLEYFKIGYAPGNDQLLNLIKSNYDNLVQENDEFELNKLINNSFLVIDKKGDYHDFFNDRIIFSIYDHLNNIVGFSGRIINNEKTPKYLNTKTTLVFKKDEILYNFNNVITLDDNHQLFIVEGFMDAITTHKSNKPNVVATMGVELSNKHLETIANYGIKDLILCFDNDHAGFLATKKQVLKLANLAFNIFVVDHKNNDCKDIDEYANKYGYDATNKLLEQQLHISEFLLLDITNTNKSTPSLKHSYKQDCFEIIQKYGDIFYIDKYVDFINQTLQMDEVLLKKIIEELLIKKQSKPIQNKENEYSYVYQDKKYHKTKKQITQQSFNNKKLPLTKINKHFNHLVIILLMNRKFLNRFDSQIRNKFSRNQNLIVNIIEDFYLYNFEVNAILKDSEIFIEFINKNYAKYDEIINQFTKIIQVVKYNPKLDNLIAFELAKNSFLYEWYKNEIKHLKLTNLNLDINDNQEQIANNEKLIKQYNDEKVLLDNLINASLFHKNQ
ncbi:DNA primase [Ureaplasma urealyticum]|uniref:DNA primase n=1 Tax=Ureaplasma urealyticum serovar 8 str. ATCC 27618 TaxID=626095 RepID=A0ABM9XJ46_UREUR|nr:DNA primase [Ureaplasma urealyticum]EDX53635.1 DNA primase [Ureaplasma urealyticum serovar 9 str. ATCC 33175]EDU06156.1 DNA primase [Ureaplasma urealyticum serovar 5 str. ATCC 27817]EDU57132.1 DNA primase [Ureaplasma urealyticum serovar 7 str. ATCC 27819]EDU67138.1 DNA primase [Ureaplasma urealyticum serovar 11 str. ATCC 33695]EEH01168.1 DNA primase [Ureaplasma urealyticum serovar 8 str. ATCC 27618]